MAEYEQERRYPRVAPRATIFVAWQVGIQRVVSQLESLAIGGFFIRTPDPPPERSLVHLLVDLPNGEVRARAVVRRTAGRRGMGVEIIAMAPEDRARLGQWLRPYLGEA
jgi:PilZ domain